MSDDGLETDGIWSDADPEGRDPELPEAEPCRCERAVRTAYRELRASGVADPAAFGACATLYRIHHGEASLGEARLLVSEWIDHALSVEPASAEPTPPGPAED